MKVPNEDRWKYGYIFVDPENSSPDAPMVPAQYENAVSPEGEGQSLGQSVSGQEAGFSGQAASQGSQAASLGGYGGQAR